MNQIIWYSPEGNDTPDIGLDLSNCTRCINIDDILVNTNIHTNLFMIYVPTYIDVFRQKWVSLLNSIERIQQGNQQFKNMKYSNDINIILTSCECLSEKEWLIFRIFPTMKMTIHFITKSLVSMNESIRSRAELRRIPCSHHTVRWHNDWWLESAKRIRRLIQKPFSREWREVNKIIHEWILFNVDYESAIFYTLKELDEHSLEIRCSVMEEILSLLSILSSNRTRESTKSTIIATTRQHMFYIIECCLLVIHKAYHQ